VAVAAVALIVDGGSLVTADAFLPHVEGTTRGKRRLRVGFRFFADGEKRRRPLRDDLLLDLIGGQRREDRLALGLVRLRRDVSGRHQWRVMLAVVAAD